MAAPVLDRLTRNAAIRGKICDEWQHPLRRAGWSSTISLIVLTNTCGKGRALSIGNAIRVF